MDGRDRLVGLGLPGASRSSGMPAHADNHPCANSSICGAELPDHGTNHLDDCCQLCHRGDTATTLDGLWSGRTRCVGRRDKWRRMHFSLGIDCPNVCGTKKRTADVCRRVCTTRRSITSRGSWGMAHVQGVSMCKPLAFPLPTLYLGVYPVGRLWPEN